MDLDKANSLQSRLEIIHGRLKSIVETKVTYKPGNPLEMAEEAIKSAQQHARACMTIVDQVFKGIEDEVAVQRAEQNAHAQLGL